MQYRVTSFSQYILLRNISFFSINIGSGLLHEMRFNFQAHLNHLPRKDYYYYTNIGNFLSISFLYRQYFLLILTLFLFVILH